MDASANQPTLPLQTLTDSIPRRVQVMYDARGGHTNY
jgi:hypothetical protein